MKVKAWELGIRRCQKGLGAAPRFDIRVIDDTNARCVRNFTDVKYQSLPALGPVLAHMVPQYVYDQLLGKPDLEVKYEEILVDNRKQAATIRQRVAEDRARRAARPQKLPHPSEAYAGTYENSELGRMTWRVTDGKLEATIGLLQSVAEVYNGEENQLRVELRGGGEVVSFHFDGERADSMTYLQAPFQRVKE